MTELAHKIAVGQADIEMREIQWNSFPDGFPQLIVKDLLPDIAGRDVAFLASLDSPEDIFSQISLLYFLPHQEINSLKILLPYFPTATMEREDRGEIATARTLALMLSQVPPTSTGSAIIFIYDIHATVVKFYFEVTVRVKLQSAMPLIEADLNAHKESDNIAVGFPDEGASKRFGKDYFQYYPKIQCDKRREDGNKRTVVLRSGNPDGRHVVIIDDLVHTGGTLIATKDVLMHNGAKSVSAAIPHGVFPEKSWKRFVNNGFSEFWITDSCPYTVKSLNRVKPFNVLSLYSLLRNDIRCK